MESEILFPDVEKKLCENTISYLHSISNLSGLNVPALRSIYSTKRRLIELRQSIFLPSVLNKTTVKCQRCQLNLLDGPASYHIKPAKKSSKFFKKITAKEHNDKPLTSYQRKYLSKMNQWSGNRLAITCKFCMKESLIKLEKPRRLKKSTTKPEPPKKKKKKDKFCGLNKEIVLSAANNIRKQERVQEHFTSNENRQKKSRFLKLKDDKVKNKSTEGSKETKKENMVVNQIKKKNSMNKLIRLVQNTESKPSPVDNLKKFLKGL